RQQFPAKRSWITAMTRFGVKVSGSSVRGVELINLRPPSVRVPGISINLLHLDDLAEVNQESPTFGTGTEKEISSGFVLFGRQFAVMQHVEVTAVFVPRAIDNLEAGAGGGIIFRRAGDVREFEVGSGLFVGIMGDGSFERGLGTEGRGQKAENEEERGFHG